MNRVESILSDLTRNEFASAEAYVKKHVPKSPSQRDSLYRIALALSSRMNHALASVAYQNILRWNAADSDCIARLASARLQCGQNTEALYVCEAALKAGHRSHGIYAGQAAALIHLGQWQAALSPAMKAIEGLPTNPGYFELLGTALMHLNRDTEAIAAYRKALEINQYHVSAYVSLATLFYRNKMSAEASKFASMALKLAPEHLGALRVNIEFALAEEDYQTAKALLSKARARFPVDLTLKRLESYLFINEGNIDAANQRIDELIESGVVDPGVLLTKTLLSKAGRHASLTALQLESLVQLVASSGNTPIKLSAACFAISNHYQSVGEFDKDFEYLNKANEYTRIARGYTPDGQKWLADTEKKIALYSPGVIAQCVANNESHLAPIFIIGMPRSGSTLVEQVLDAHPALHGLGEVDYLKTAIEAAMARQEKTSKAKDTPGFISQCLPLVAEFYAEQLQAHHSLKGCRPVDKMLMNYQSVNFILGAFPDARIVHVSRHPLDNCMAMYRRLFQDDRMNFSTDLACIGSVYISYRKLMAHWQSVFPGRIHDVSYEQLVTDSEQQIRLLLDYCQLPWDDACASAHLSGRRVKTASVVQVRQPIYTTAVGRWQQYQRQLRPLQCQLEQAGINC